MFTLKFQNESGLILPLTQDESNYQIISVQGLNPPNATIYSSQIANMDGAKFKSSKVEVRNIVVQVRLNGDVERNRQELYRYFRTGKWCKIFYKNENRNVYIEGYCESFECDLFTNNEVAQISIVCPQPYFVSVDTIITDITKAMSAFYFPFSITSAGIPFSTLSIDRTVAIRNQGEVDTGLIIRIKTDGTSVLNPVIYNHETNEFFKLLLTVQSGDEIIIDTNKGHKSVKKNGTNILNLVDAQSTWLDLKVGDNVFTYNAGSNVESLRITFEYNNMYEGV